LEDAHAFALLCVVSFNAVQVQRLRPKLCLKCIYGMLAALGCRIALSTSRAEFNGGLGSALSSGGPGELCRRGFIGPIDHSLVPFPPSAIPLPIGAGRAAKPLRFARRFEAAVAFLADLPLHVHSSALRRTAT
jgi:hypothetical protein